MTKYWRDAASKFLRSTSDNIDVVSGGFETPVGPPSGRGYTWDDATSIWIEAAGRADDEAGREIGGVFEAGRIERLLFAMSFDQEKRLRALEGAPAITKAQYRGALLARLKAL